MTRFAAVAALVGCGSSEQPASTTTYDATTPPEPDATSDAEDPGADVTPEASTKSGAICSRDGWCWDTPSPQGNDLYGVWGSEPSDLYAVGQLGALLRFDGSAWTAVSLATRDAFRAVWGTGPDDVWAVGDQTAITHFDGTAWSVMPFPAMTTAKLDGGRLPRLSSIAGTSKTHVWAVGEGGTILHYDGTAWSNSDSGSSANLRAVCTLQADDAWAVGDGGAVLHFDGTKWIADTKAGLAVNLLAVHALAKNDVWAVGAQGTIGHFDGAKWTKVVVDATTTLRTVIADGTDSVWAAGDSGATWHLTSTSVGEAGVEAGADGGDGGSGSRDAGSDAPVRTWTKVPNGGTKANFYAAVRRKADDICFVGSRGEILRWSAGSWQRVAKSGTANRLAISAAGGEAWVVGDETLRLGRDGWIPSPAGTDRALYGLSYTSATGGWAVGTAGTIVRLDSADAGSWTVIDSPSTRWLHAIWTSGSAAGWIVGGAGTALALVNGSIWQPISTGGITVDLLDVWGNAIDDVWAVGQGGTILHWRTSSWSLVSNGADGGMTNDLHGVWGSGAKDIWAVGTRGTILHYDGSSWSTSITGEAYSLNDVWGISATNVWAVGTGGTILHWNGSAWKPQESGTDSSLNTVGGSDGRVFAAGENSTILRLSIP